MLERWISRLWGRDPGSEGNGFWNDEDFYFNVKKKIKFHWNKINLDFYKSNLNEVDFTKNTRRFVSFNQGEKLIWDSNTLIHLSFFFFFTLITWIFHWGTKTSSNTHTHTRGRSDRKWSLITVSRFRQWTWHNDCNKTKDSLHKFAWFIWSYGTFRSSLINIHQHQRASHWSTPAPSSFLIGFSRSSLTNVC